MIRYAPGEHADGYQLVYRHFGLDARTVVHDLARMHIEGYLPCPCFGFNSGNTLRFQLPQRVYFEQVVEKVLQRVWRDSLKLTIQIKGCYQRSTNGVTL